jgi:hypothetical protein
MRRLSPRARVVLRRPLPVDAQAKIAPGEVAARRGEPVEEPDWRVIALPGRNGSAARTAVTSP